MITEVAATADPSALEQAAAQLARAAAGLGDSGSRLPQGPVAGWSSGGAHATTTRGDADRATAAWRSAKGHGADPGADARDRTSRALARAQDDLQLAAARAAAMLRQAASAAPRTIPAPRKPVGPHVQSISWGDALDKAVGAGKTVARGAEEGASAVGDAAEVGGEALAHAAEAGGKAIARGDKLLVQGAGDDLTSLVGFIDDLNRAVDGTAHQILSSLGGSMEEVWAGLEKVVGARPSDLLSPDSLGHWGAWFGKLGLAVSLPEAKAALKIGAAVSKGALAVGKALTTDYGHYGEIAAQTGHPPIKGGPTYDKIHRTQQSDHHILDGSARGGGGHRARAGWGGETEFPESWSDRKILQTIDEAARNPVSEMSRSVARGGELRFSYEGRAGGLLILIALDGKSRIVSGYARKRQPGTYTNPQKPPGKPIGTTGWGPKWVRADRDPRGAGYFVWHRFDGGEIYTDRRGIELAR